MQVGLLNVEGYYNSLLTLFDNGVEEGFIKPGARDIVLAAPTARELLSKMEVLNLPNFHVFVFDESKSCIRLLCSSNLFNQSLSLVTFISSV